MSYKKLLLVPTLLGVALMSQSVFADGHYKSGCSGGSKGGYHAKKSMKSWDIGKWMQKMETKMYAMELVDLLGLAEKMKGYMEGMDSSSERYDVFVMVDDLINQIIDNKSKEDIVLTAVNSEQFPTLVAAVQAAGLVESLQGTGPFTVFAPTEEAFANLLVKLGVTAEELLVDKELLTSVLTYHVVPGIYEAKEVIALKGETSIETLQGSSISIDPNNGAPTVNGVSIVSTDIFASNGVIHVIDEVLLP